MRPWALCLSVDLDPIWAYEAIHGLDPNPDTDTFPLVRLGLERFTDLARDLRMSVTWFIVGQTLRDPDVQDLVRAVASGRHELANHTWSHPYHFPTLGAEELAAEVKRAHEAIQAFRGSPPIGFRAPGYGGAPSLGGILAAEGYRYDSSMLPSPPYYVAKATIMAHMRLRGRSSRSHLHDPRTVLGPKWPYRFDPDAPWKAGQGPLWEVPITCLPGRIPFIGTTVTLLGSRFGPSALRAVARLLADLPFVNFECHALDLVDASDSPRLAALAPYQPDLRIPWRTKRYYLAVLLTELLVTHHPTTLESWIRVADRYVQRYRK